MICIIQKGGIYEKEIICNDPFIGIVFQVLSLFPAFLDLSAHHFGQERFTVINARYTTGNFRETRKKEKAEKKSMKKPKPKFKDAEFKEK